MRAGAAAGSLRDLRLPPAGRLLGGGAVLLDVFQGELELLGIEAFGLRPALTAQQLLEDRVQPLAFRLGFLVGHLEVVALFLQSTECSAFLLQKSSYFVQPGTKLIEVFWKSG